MISHSGVYYLHMQNLKSTNLPVTSVWNIAIHCLLARVNF
jgi:hypothetical protein